MRAGPRELNGATVSSPRSWRGSKVESSSVESRPPSFVTGAATELRVALGDGCLLRSATTDDAPALAAAYLRNRAHLAPWDPLRRDEFFTVDEQARRLESRVASDARGESITAVVVDGADAVVAGVNVNDIVRAVFCNGHLGYWTDAEHTGRGLMTRAVAAVCDPPTWANDAVASFSNTSNAVFVAAPGVDDRFDAVLLDEVLGCAPPRPAPAPRHTARARSGDS